MKVIQIQANKIKGKDTYQLSASTNDVIENSIFIEINEEDLEDINMMMDAADM